jgi:lysophospholipid hydrolase
VLLREFGRHELVGELEVLTETARTTTVHAVRDAELAKVPAGLLHLVKHRHPRVATHLMRLMSERLLQLVNGEGDKQGSNLSTVAILPASENVPLTAFTRRLAEALNLYGPTLHLNAAMVEETFGVHPCDARGSQEYSLVR